MSYLQNKSYFVTPEYILESYSLYLDNNIDANSISGAILIAQAEQTQQILGYTLYQKFITLINTSTIGDSDNVRYKYLLDNYIVDSVSLWSIWYCLDSLALRATNKGVEQKNSQFSQPVSSSQLTKLKTAVMERAQFVDARTREYILNFPGDYPEYYQVTGVLRMTPKANPYDNFLATGKNINLGGCGGCGGYLPGVGIPLWNT
jgi:hypothetical protein